MSVFLCDSCFVIALADNTEPMHKNSCDYLNSHKVGHYFLIPYPSMFETLSERMVANPLAMIRLSQIFLNNTDVNVAYISDSRYRNVSLFECMNDRKNIDRHLSFVDTIIRNMVKSRNIRKDGLITFNDDDFKDVCTQNGVELISFANKKENKLIKHSL